MEIGGPSFTDYATMVAREPLAAVAARAGGTGSDGHPAVVRGFTDAVRARAGDDRLVAGREAKTGHDAEPPRAAQASATAAMGGLQFVYEDGYSLMRAYDSKDVLIYQVPSKGQLELIKVQDEAAETQVLTSA